MRRRYPPVEEPPPSWTRMSIEEAEPNPPSRREAVPVLLSAIAEVFSLWWRRYVTRDASVGYARRAS